MPAIGSNQYPALHWQSSPDTVHGGIIAWPHGEAPEHGRARVYFAKQYSWIWVTHWPDRFSRNSSAASEELAKAEATVAYWDFMEKTEGWQPKPPPAPQPPLDPQVQAVREAVEGWLARKPAEAAIREQVGRFMIAALRGPTIHTAEIDHWVWSRLSQAFANREYW